MSTCVCALLHRGGVVNQSLGSHSSPGERGSAVRKAKRALLLESCRAFFMAHPSCFIGNTHISELQLCLPKTGYCGHVVALVLRGTTADPSLSCNNSHPFKSSWLQYINPLFLHVCGQVSRCFQHPGWNREWWDKFGPLELRGRLYVGEELSSPESALLPQHSQNELLICTRGERKSEPEGEVGVPQKISPQLPRAHSWLLRCLFERLIRQGKRKKPNPPTPPNSDLSFSFKNKSKIQGFFKRMIHVSKKSKFLRDYLRLLSSQLSLHDPSIK